MRTLKIVLIVLGFALLFQALNLGQPRISFGEFIGLAWLMDAPLYYQAGFLGLLVLSVMALWDLLSRKY